MKETISPVDYDELVATCDLAQLCITGAELHGQIVGEHLARQVRPFDQWLATLCKEAELIDSLQEEDQQLLKNLYQQTPIELNRIDLGFQLLLPDDDYPIEQRLDAIAQWTQGFLAGLASAGVQDKQIQGEVKETIADLIQIAQIDGGEIGSDEEAGKEAERDYAEIVEYVRMAVLLLHAELAGVTRHD